MRTHVRNTKNDLVVQVVWQLAASADASMKTTPTRPYILKKKKIIYIYIRGLCIYIYIHDGYLAARTDVLLLLLLLVGLRLRRTFSQLMIIVGTQYFARGYYYMHNERAEVPTNIRRYNA